MSFVFYDVETSGLRPGFDQILHFAAIKTDFDLCELARAEFRSRLMPHVLPSPAALCINGLRIGQLTNPNLPSHYQMVCSIRDQLRDWCPSIFAGYNSIRFDEEFLRQALYQCLHDPYLTSGTGNGRLDVLSVARAAAVLVPGCLEVPVDADGRAVFRLEALAAANGFSDGRSHEALSDVEATLFVARMIKARAPDVWSQAARFGAKRAVLDFIAGEEAFMLVDGPWTAAPLLAVAILGASPRNPNLRYCLNLAHDPRLLSELSEADLSDLLARGEQPLVSFKVNSAPLLFSLDDVPQGTHISSVTVSLALERAAVLKGLGSLRARLLEHAQSAERIFERSAEVEQQLYEGFWCAEDARVLEHLHDVPWEERPPLISQIKDQRLRVLGRRLLFLERPDLLPAERVERAHQAVNERLFDSNRPWTTFDKALSEIHEVAVTADATGRSNLGEYQLHLEKRRDSGNNGFTGSGIAA